MRHKAEETRVCMNKLIIVVQGVLYTSQFRDMLLTQHGTRAGGLSRPPQLYLGARGSGCITALMFMHVRLRLVCLLVSL